MRAIPSPTEMTVPTSARSVLPLVALDLLADDLADLVDLDLHGYSWTMLSAQPVELGAQAAVVDDGADPGDRSADEARIGSQIQADALAGHPLERELGPALEVVGERDRRGDVGREDPRRPLAFFVEQLGDRGERRGPPVIHEDAEEVDDRAGHAVTLGQRDQHGAPSGAWECGVEHQPPELLRLFHGPAERAQELVPLLGALRAGKAGEQRPRVLRGQLAILHGGVPRGLAVPLNPIKPSEFAEVITAREGVSKASVAREALGALCGADRSVGTDPNADKTVGQEGIALRRDARPWCRDERRPSRCVRGHELRP